MQPAPFKLGTFSIAGCRPFAGLVLDNRVISLSALRTLGRASSRLTGETILEVLAEWESNFAALQDIVHEMLDSGRSPELQQHSCTLDQVHVHAPLPEPRTLYCSGANYKKHVVDLIIAHQDQAATQGMSLEQKRAWGMKLMDERAADGTPFIFIKPQSTVTGPFDPIIVPYDARKPDWELELAVVIGKRARRVARDCALDHVAWLHGSQRHYIAREGVSPQNGFTRAGNGLRLEQGSAELSADGSLPGTGRVRGRPAEIARDPEAQRQGHAG